MVIGLVLTHSKMGNTAFFSSLIAAGSIGLVLSKRAPRATVVLLLSLVAIDIALVGTWFGAEKIVSGMKQASVAEAPERMEVSEYTFRHLNDYLWTGAGGGSFYVGFPRSRTGDLFHFYDHAHDDYAELGSEYGIAGMILLTCIVLSSLYAALLAQHRRRDPLMRGMAFSSTMGIIARMIHSLADFNLQIPANAATFMVILSLGWISLYLE
jgi:O-antigen ligase